MRARRVAGWILAVTGMAHAGGLLRDLFVPTFFVPTDPALLSAMRATPVAVATWVGARMTVWSAHVGWNLSFPLGLLFLGALQLRLARIDADRSRGGALDVATLVAAVAFTLIAAARFFWAPFLLGAAATIALVFVVGRRRPAASSERAAPPVDGAWLFYGALGMGLAGALHAGVGSIVDAFRPWAYAPTDASVLHAMQTTTIALPAMFGVTRSFWDAYSGFSAAHGVVVTIYAVCAFLLGRRLDARIGGDRVVRALFAAASCAWLAIATTCWFVAPMVVTAIAATCHVVAFVRARPVTPPRRSSP